ncbi:MAG TPA: hypothetical protein VF454_02565 [Gemmatimonadales bacterium]
MSRSRSLVLALGLLAVAGCHRAIVLETRPLDGPPPTYGPGDVIAYAERAGGLQPIHQVALPPGDLDYRFAIINHGSLYAPTLIVRLTRTGSRVRGEAWCHQFQKVPPRTPMPWPERAELAHVRRVDWSSLLRRVLVLELYAWRSPPPRHLAPGEPMGDDPYVVFEGRDGTEYRGFGRSARDSASAHQLAELHSIAAEVWGEHGSCFGQRGPIWPTTTGVAFPSVWEPPVPARK